MRFHSTKKKAASTSSFVFRSAATSLVALPLTAVSSQAFSHPHHFAQEAAASSPIMIVSSTSTTDQPMLRQSPFLPSLAAAALIPPPADQSSPLVSETMLSTLVSPLVVTPAFPAPKLPFVPEPVTLLDSQKSLRKVLQISNGVSSSSSSSSSLSTRPYIVGHRGALYDALENTIPAFRACANTCDAVELDVFEIKDKSLVVFHGSGTDQAPGRLEEYCGVPGSILDLTLEEARALKFNPQLEEFGCSSEKILQGQIPTLEEVLLDIRENAPSLHVKIELKGPGTAVPVLALVEKLDMVDQCSYSSFDHSQIATLRALRPQVNPETGKHVYPTGALFDEVPTNFLEMAQSVGASEIHLRYDTCTTERIQAIHQANMGSMAWMRGPVGMRIDTTQKYLDVGNEDERCFETILASGVQQMCINKPDVLYRMYQQKPSPALAA